MKTLSLLLGPQIGKKHGQELDKRECFRLTCIHVLLHMLIKTASNNSHDLTYV